MAVTDIAGSRGIAFLVGATLMADMIAKACSSPQTVETNAGRRASTAMKWANIGLPVCPANAKHGVLACELPDTGKNESSEEA